MQQDTAQFQVIVPFVQDTPNRQAQTTVPASKFDSHEHVIAIQIIIKIIQRNYSRHFIKRMTFAFIQSLRKSHYLTTFPIKHQQTINWPFKDLYAKKYRNEQENELFQFVNLCAEMIQSRFKGYMTRKRHKLAISRAKKGRDLLNSFVKRWKVYRTYNCEKIWQIRGKIKQIQKQIDQQQQKYTNRDAKKLKGLYKYLQIYTKMFKETFNLLMQTGMWILEKNMKQKTKTLQIKKEANAQNRRRARQFGGEGRQVKQIENVKDAEIEENKKQNLDHNISRQYISKNTNTSTDVGGFQDRPIKAAGEYKFNENEIEDNLSQVRHRKQAAREEQGKQMDENQAKKAKEINKKVKQLEKRTKYDPRKAIEQEKKKKQLNELTKNESTPISNPKQPSKPSTNQQTSKNQQKKTKQTLKKVQPAQQNKPKLEEEKKTDIKSERQRKIQTKGKNAGKELQTSSSKQVVKKIGSKVDCWANKKEVEPDWVKSYKSRILQNRQSSEQKVEPSLTKSIQKLIKKVQQKNRTYIGVDKQQNQTQSIPRKHLKSQPQQQSGVQSWRNRQKQIEQLKQKQEEFMGHRKNSSQNLQQVRVILQKKSKQKQKRKEVHRSIQQLEQTYNKHYGDRYQNLMPKLGLVGAARMQESRRNAIWVVEDGDDADDWFFGVYNSTQYWKMISQQDRIFKSFTSS